MARIIGGIGTSHVPAIGKAIAKGLQRDAYWKPFFDGFKPVHDWLAKNPPDIVVVFYNDHGLNFFLNNMPTFAIGAADQYSNADEGWGLPVAKPFKGDANFSWHLIESLVAEDFDMATCQEMLVDHAFAIPLALLWPDSKVPPVRVVPISINTVQHPLPSARRCFRLGRTVGRAIRSYPGDANVLVLGTGGLSHQLEGTRAGFINKTFDTDFLNLLPHDPEMLTKYSTKELVDLTGSQGVELLMWLAMRGALEEPLSLVQRNYHIPISNTAAALMLLETQNIDAGQGKMARVKATLPSM